MVLIGIPAFKASLSSFDSSWMGLEHENYWFVLGSVVVLGPLVEELMFRGLIHNAARKAAGIWVSIALSALIFGIWHRELVQSIYVVVVGIGLGIVYEQTGKLRYPIF